MGYALPMSDPNLQKLTEQWILQHVEQQSVEGITINDLHGELMQEFQYLDHKSIVDQESEEFRRAFDYFHDLDDASFNMLDDMLHALAVRKILDFYLNKGVEHYAKKGSFDLLFQKIFDAEKEKIDKVVSPCVNALHKFLPFKIFGQHYVEDKNTGAVFPRNQSTEFKDTKSDISGLSGILRFGVSELAFNLWNPDTAKYEFCNFFFRRNTVMLTMFLSDIWGDFYAEGRDKKFIDQIVAARSTEDLLEIPEFNEMISSAILRDDLDIQFK